MKQHPTFYRMIAAFTMVCALVATLAVGGGIPTASAATGTKTLLAESGSMEGKSFGTYRGDMKDGNPHGSGTIDFDYGATFQGKFVHGYPSGYGTYIYEDGSRVSGEWSWGFTDASLDSSRNGTDLFYVGMFCDDEACGYGEVTMEKCGTFYGEFYDGNVDGYGVYVYERPMPQSQPTMEGDNWKTVYDSYKHDHRYNGLTLNGLWQGFGIGVMSNGNYYVGEIRNEFRSGYGRLYVGGNVYQKGAFQDGGLVIPD